MRDDTIGAMVATIMGVGFVLGAWLTHIRPERWWLGMMLGGFIALCGAAFLLGQYRIERPAEKESVDDA